LESLVDEGFRVVVLPIIEEWGNAGRVLDLIGRMAPERSRHVAVAPDPADPPAWLRERDELDPADRVMRFFKFLIARADQVVAVEGWVAHLASLLGRPVRMVLWAGSFTPDWYARDAVWAAGLSARCPPRSLDLSGAEESAPVLSKPDRGLLALALGGVRQPQALVRLVPKLSSSLDPELRALAVRTSASLLGSPPFAEIATQALADPAPTVRRAAAETWLGRPDLERHFPALKQTLEAHRSIAEERWAELGPLGEAALSALAVAARGQPDFIRDQSRRLLQSMLRQRVGWRVSGDAAPPPGDA
ncbi:MAG: hypothetical protein AAFY88_13310, partial [Acidobacteriota bacterium]